MALDVYRAPTLPRAAPLPPRELVYEAIDRDRDRGVAVAWFQLFSLPALLGIVIGSVTTPAVGLVAMVAAGAFAVWHRRRNGRGEGAVLRIEKGELVVLARSRREEKARIRLRDLEDVSLEIKTIQRVQEGDSAVPGVRFVDTRVGPEIDTARIVLLPRKGRGVQLTDEYLAHMDATEWLGKIRVFLRKHGWLPRDERKDVKEKDAPVTRSDESLLEGSA